MIFNAADYLLVLQAKGVDRNGLTRAIDAVLEEAAGDGNQFPLDISIETFQEEYHRVTGFNVGAEFVTEFIDFHYNNRSSGYRVKTVLNEPVYKPFIRFTPRYLSIAANNATGTGNI